MAATQTTAQPATPVAVEIDATGADAGEVLGAIDAVLASELPAVAVLVMGSPRGGSEALRAACEADPRVELDGASAAGEGGVRMTMPARARPAPDTLPALCRMLSEDGLAELSVPVPGALGRLQQLGVPPRLAARRRLRAFGSGTGSRWIGSREVGLSSTRSEIGDRPPPQGDLAHERAEHLRHRARGATYRTRMDRAAQRLARERLQTRHEAARARLAEQRLASRSTSYLIAWRARTALSMLAVIPRAIPKAWKTVRVFVRRVRRFAVDRFRTWRGAN